MSTRQLSIGDFAAHCLEAVQAVQSGDTVLEILSSGGKVIAVLNPAPQKENGGSLSDWMTAGETPPHECLLEEPLPPYSFEPASLDFWQPRTARQQALMQQTNAVSSPESLLGDGTVEEWMGFDEALESWRSEHVTAPPPAAAPHAA